MKIFMNPKFYHDLCIKSLTGNISEYEKKELDKWLANSRENENEYLSMKLLWEDSLIYSKTEIPDESLEWDSLSRVLISRNENRRITEPLLAGITFYLKKKVNIRLKPVIAGAVGIIIILSVILLIDKSVYTPHYKFVTSSDKAIKECILPDGSKAVLNKNSSIRFPERFYGGTRNIQLKGEAYFSVIKDKNAFIVFTKNAKTTVLGTKFDIWSRDDETRVIVKEGNVNLASQFDDPKGVNLIKDQVSCVVKNEKPESPKIILSNNYLSWISGELVFQRTSLNVIISDLERFYNCNISLGKGNFKNLSVTGTFKGDNLENTLKMLCLTLHLEYKKTENGYLIYSIDPEG